MVQINFAQKSVTVKIVYYGPGMSGKTTNLEVVHQRAPGNSRGELTSISTDGDRTLFFDFMPLDLGTVAGMRTQFQIYTVPGQVYYNSTRKLVLQGVDGVIFVGDSSASMVEENLESLRNLEENLAEYGKSLDDIPCVIQYNKRDLPDALPTAELEKLLNPRSLPSFEAVANSGQGVFPTLKALAAIVLDSIHAQTGSGARARAAAAAPTPAQPPIASPVPQAGSAQVGAVPAQHAQQAQPLQAQPQQAMQPQAMPVAMGQPPVAPVAPAVQAQSHAQQPQAPIPQPPAAQQPQLWMTAPPQAQAAPPPAAPAQPLGMAQPAAAPSLPQGGFQQPAAEPQLSQTGYHQQAATQALKLNNPMAQPQVPAGGYQQQQHQPPPLPTVPPQQAAPRAAASGPAQVPTRLKPRAVAATPTTPSKKSSVLTILFVIVALGAGVAIGGFAFNLF